MPDRVLGSQPVFEGRILRVTVDEVESPDGHRGTREVVRTRGAVAALCVHEGSFVLVRQYRHAVGEALLEIPAGIVDEGEDPETAAARELVEEVGLRPRRLERLAGYYASPGFTNHRLEVFFTDDVEEAEQNLDAGEVVDIERRPVASARELISSGEIRDAKTLLALALYLLRS